jgi:hypothetical protein
MINDLINTSWKVYSVAVSDKKDATRVFERFNFLTVTATEPYSMCNR